MSTAARVFEHVPLQKSEIEDSFANMDETAPVEVCEGIWLAVRSDAGRNPFSIPPKAADAKNIVAAMDPTRRIFEGFGWTVGFIFRGLRPGSA